MGYLVHHEMKHNEKRINEPKNKIHISFYWFIYWFYFILFLKYCFESNKKQSIFWHPAKFKW